MTARARNLTASVVERLQPRATRYEVADATLPGLRLRVTPNGVKTWAVMYRRQDGVRVRYTLGKHGVLTVKQAREMARATLGEVAQNNDPQSERKQKRTAAARAAAVPTLKKYLQGLPGDEDGAAPSDFVKWITAEQRTGVATVKRLRAAFPEFLEKPLPSITPWALLSWRAAKLKDHIDAATVNRDIAALGTLFRHAMQAGIVTSSPTRTSDVLRPLKTVEKTAIRALKPDEEQRLRAALAKRDEELRSARERGNARREERSVAPMPTIGREQYGDHITPMVLLTLNTGLRRGELFGLRWESVELTAQQPRITVVAATSKSGKSRTLPLNAEAVAVLKRWRAQQPKAEGLVFPSPMKPGERLDNVNKAWAAVLTAAKVKGFRWHDMRHTFATRLVEAGVPLPHLQRLLGHADIRMSMRYTHVNDRNLAEAVAKLGAAR